MSANVHYPSVEIGRPADMGGGVWKLSNLRPITVMFGKNGSGKSRLLRAWRDFNVEGSHYVVPERTGSLGVNPSYLQHQSNAQQRQGQSTQNFVSEYRQQTMTRIQALYMARGSSRTQLKTEVLGRFEALLSSLVADFEFELAYNPPYRLRRLSTGEVIEDVNRLSSGEAQVLTLGVDILTIVGIWGETGTNAGLLLIDEPDAHIHPDLQARFADFLVSVANEFDIQVVVATHSTTLLAALGQFAAEDCGVIYLDRTGDDFLAQPFTATLKEVAACLGGHALMGPLFGAPILLVEGDDDFRIWSQVPRHHVVSFAVLPCNGQEIYNYQVTLERVFASLRDPSDQPAGYALLDLDKPMPSASRRRKQEHVRFIRLNCREAENLYLTDEVLASLSMTWGTAVKAIVDASVLHGDKAAFMGDAREWDRRMVDLKGFMGEISQAIDPKAVHWTHRVGQVVGRGRPSGQLADFLGEPVIQALWPAGHVSATPDSAVGTDTA